MDRICSRRAGQRRVGSGYSWALVLALGSLWSHTMPVSHVEARKYGRRVRAKDECKSPINPSVADSEKARRYYESAIIYYDTKEYAQARREFQSAYDISKDPEFLVNLSAVASRQKQYQDAVKFLEQYIEECPNAPDTFAARSRLDDLRIAQAIQEGEKPPPKTVYRYPPKGALALMGAGLGGVLLGVGLGGGALAAARQIDSVNNQNRVFDSGLQAVDSRGNGLQGAGIFFDVVGGAALASGIIWTLVWHQQRDGLTLTLAPRPGGFLVGGSF